MPIQGVFEAIDHYQGEGWFAKGWAFDPAAPNAPVQLVLYADDKVITPFLANRARQDLIDAGLGNGKHAFELKLPPSLLHGRPVRLQILIEQEQRILPSTAPDWFTAPVVAGKIEHLDQGRLSGWAANNTPGRPPQLDISVDGKWVACITCTIPRPDLQQQVTVINSAGFHYNLPLALYDGKPHSIALHVANTTTELDGSPLQVNMPAGLTTTRQRTLQAELQALQESVRSYEDLLAKETPNWLADTATYARWLQQHEQDISTRYAPGKKAATKTLPSLAQKQLDTSSSGSTLHKWLQSCSADAISFIGAQDKVHALWPAAAAQALRNKHCDVVYCDEDVRPARGPAHSPFFKPDFDPDRLLGHNYIGLACAVRTTALQRALSLLPKDAGTWPATRWAATVLDLVLLNTDPARVLHLPQVLYHRSKAWKATIPARERAPLINSQLQRSGVAATVKVQPGDVLHVQRALPAEPPEVLLLIPTRDRLDLLEKCISSILRLTDYPKYRILIIDNDSREAATLAYFKSIAKTPQVQMQRWPGAFNYSAMHNDVIAQQQVPFVALVNNDIEALHADWLREMMSQALRPEVGAVGAKLLYPNGLVQHGGVVVGMHGVADNAQRAFAGDESGYFNSLRVVQNCSAVTAACLVCRREDYLAVGGMDAQNLPIAFNDVDLCLKLGQAGKRIVWTPFATLYHHESATRGRSASIEHRQAENKEAAHLARKWNTPAFTDPFYSPNISLREQSHVDFHLASDLLLSQGRGNSA